jgi:hypothetical protein
VSTKMEKNITKIIAQYELDRKRGIKEWFAQNNAQVTATVDGDESTANTSEFLKFVYDADGPAFSPEDFKKRKRVKNPVPQYELCVAYRAVGSEKKQCTRRRRNDEQQLCGTHLKGTPHGVMNTNEMEAKSALKKEVWVQEIKGINYYIDEHHNVYKPEDIIANKTSPAVIALWALSPTGTYTIPAFGI